MSIFPSFKLPQLPQLLRKSLPVSEIFEDAPRLKCSELPVKQRIGQGSFGDVNTSEYKGSEDTKCQTVVIKKMLQVLGKEGKKQSTDFHFAKYRFSFRKVQIFISQSTDFHFAKYRFHFVSFRFAKYHFAKYNKPPLRYFNVKDVRSHIIISS